MYHLYVIQNGEKDELAPTKLKLLKRGLLNQLNTIGQKYIGHLFVKFHLNLAVYIFCILVQIPLSSQEIALNQTRAGKSLSGYFILCLAAVNNA